MKLRTKYIVFIAILHLVTLVLSYFVLKIIRCSSLLQKYFILISLVFAWQLYNQLLQPLQTLMRGVEAIKDQDFNIKFVQTGKHEMDQLISVYNNMIDELRQERTKQEQQHFFLEKLIHTSPVGILILDHDENVHYLNPKATEVLGVGEKEIIGRPVQGINLGVMAAISSLQNRQCKIDYPQRNSYLQASEVALH